MAKVLTLSASGKVEEQEISIGGGSSITGTAVIDFGNENDSAVLTISNTALTNSNIKGFSIVPQETSETSLDDFSLNGVTFNIENIINNISFDIRGNATNSASGDFTLKYLITY